LNRAHRRLGLLACTLALGTGCPSTAVLGSARPLAKGHWEAGGSLGAGGAYFDQNYIQNSETDLALWPLVPIELAARYGLMDRVEIDGNLGPFGLELGTKLGLRLSDGEPGQLDVSFAPSVGQSFFTLGWRPSNQVVLPDLSSPFTRVQLPLLLGLNLSGGAQIVLSPRAQAWGLLTTDRPLLYKFFLFTWGASAGVYLPVSPTMRLMPEVGISFGPGIYWGYAGVGVLVGN
jgi:hypothetical protein